MKAKFSNRDFLDIYINILEDLRTNGKIFSEQNPEVAPYLDLSQRKSNDPETERLIESFAYMFAQIEHGSLLSQYDYALNFIEHIFPEIVRPTPALTILKIVADKNYFNDEKDSFLIPKSTKFSTKNSSGQECFFSCQFDTFIHNAEILESRFVDVLSSRENIGNNKKAYVFDLKLKRSTKKTISEKKRLTFYINADFYTSITIYESLFNTNKPIILYNEENGCITKIPRENLKYCIDFRNYDHKNSDTNFLYPLYDFLHFHEKYFFFSIELDNAYLLGERYKVTIPVADSFSSAIHFKPDFFQLNCLPVINLFEKNLEPIKWVKDKSEYLLNASYSKKDEFEILSLSSLKTYDPKSGEEFYVQNFHEKFSNNPKNNSFQNELFWSTKRSFRNSVSENGALFLNILNNVSYDGKLSHSSAYLFPVGLCSNGFIAENLKPHSPFYCHGALPIEKSFCLVWPKSSKVSLNIIGHEEILKLLLQSNKQVVSEKILNVEDFFKILNHLCDNKNPVKNLINQVLRNSFKIEAEETLSQSFWKNQVFHIPGNLYKIYFQKENGFPPGTWFFINFLNEYFNSVRSFNSFTRFDAELI